MAREQKLHTRQNYERLLEVYRKKPAVFAAAAAAIGCDYRAAKRAWESGWSSCHPWGHRPIRDVIEEEHAAARTSVARRLEQERIASEADHEAGRKLAIEIAQADIEILRHARQNVRAIFLMSNGLAGAMGAVVQKVRAELLEPDGRPKDPALLKMDATECLKLLRHHAALVARNFEVGREIIAMDRLNDGKPSTIIGVTPLEFTPAQAAEELLAQGEAIRIIQAEAEGREPELEEHEPAAEVQEQEPPLVRRAARNLGDVLRGVSKPIQYNAIEAREQGQYDRGSNGGPE